MVYLDSHGIIIKKIQIIFEIGLYSVIALWGMPWWRGQNP